MDYLIYAFNILLLLFWVRLWSVPEKEFYFNPFISGTVKFTDSALAFLRPVLCLPEQAACAVVLVFLLLFKTLLFSRLGVTWHLSLGTYFQFSPLAAADHRAASALLFSVLHVALFFVRLWTLLVLVRLITPAFRVTRASEALAFFARPFSLLPPLAQPFALLLLHGLLAFACTRTGTLSILGQPLEAQLPEAASPFLGGPLYWQLLKTGWLAVLSFADGLMFLTRGLFILIVGNLVAALLQVRGAMIICSEGADLLLGRFARRNTAGAGFDFAPLIFFFVVNVMYGGICRSLLELIQSPFFN